MRLALAAMLLTLTLAGPALAQTPPAAPPGAYRGPDVAAQRTAMQRLAPLVGRWQGEADVQWPAAMRVHHTERVEADLDGLLLHVRGTGHANAERTGAPVFQAAAIISFNERRGTLRGMHYQAAPYAETKLVRCTMGAIYDVIIDLRPDSATFRQWLAVELTADNRLMLFIPEGFAHGFQTLTDGTEVFYHMSQVYAPEYARGVRWDDPAFKVSWPAEKRVISERDRSFADFLL